ncbi:MAG: ComEA family DNA-binding protein [Moraxellaceae bacterium]|nr:ComEA family DNA-binding protein [Moraxellaceae bacterium]
MCRQLLFLVFLTMPVLVAGAETVAPDKPVLRVMQLPAPGEGRVDINTADARELSRRLNGIGEKKAQAIVDYRNANGGFRSLAQLEQVKGIGPAIVKKNRHLIYIDARP